MKNCYSILKVSIQVNKKRLVVLVLILSIFSYSFIALLRVKTEKDNYDNALINIENIDKAIEKEEKNRKKLGNIDTKYVNNLYFDKDSDYFEEYMRGIFNKYNIKPNLYQSKMNDKKYSEMNLDFRINSIDFFKLLYSIEKGERMVNIKSFTVKKDRDNILKVNMKLRGYHR